MSTDNGVFLINTENKDQLFEFVAIKQHDLSFNVAYDTIELLKAVVLPVEYRNTTGIQRSFTLGMPQRLYSKPINDVWADIKGLTRAASDSDNNTPPVLILQYFNIIYSPVIIAGNVTLKVITSIGDVITNAELSLSLLEIPESALV